MKKTADLAAWIRQAIVDFIETSPQNTLQNKTNDKAFDKPLVGFSKGDDPLFETYKEVVGPFHWTPWEIFTRTFEGLSVTPEDLSVISWILPQTKATKADNRKLAPMLSEQWERKKSDKYVIASTWSERHAAYASGLGTFGLCDGLITPRGKAMRTGSVVAHIKLSPTKRPYSDHHAYCLFFTKGICGKCISRCPAGALDESGHDKTKCRTYIRPVTADYVKSYGCGLCQTKVPCESKIPTRQDVE